METYRGFTIRRAAAAVAAPPPPGWKARKFVYAFYEDDDWRGHGLSIQACKSQIDDLLAASIWLPPMEVS